MEQAYQLALLLGQLSNIKNAYQHYIYKMLINYHRMVRLKLSTSLSSYPKG
ncbi:hypothetical protein GCHA_0713 [Paraglaciecola chathamensis S18K6]|uniref:Uncharacterized protein n=1 Tax=Paraglaciecola chathamensis S18K6 TaxID=1127672 RepID=A0AAV3UUG6_9ALTE|nr:hypothetical protein GCHA_0713 [Paraglaciecola chathamensis S18K6]